MARNLYKDYHGLTADELREEFSRLKDVLHETTEFKVPAGYEYPELLVEINKQNRIGLRQRLEEVKRQASFKGVDLGPL